MRLQLNLTRQTSMSSPKAQTMTESAADVYRRINEWCIRGIEESGEDKKITDNSIAVDEDTSGSEEDESEDEGKEEVTPVKQVTPFDCLAPKGKDLEHRLCSKDSKLWSPAISCQGLLQLEHFLHSFQEKQKLGWLEGIYYPSKAHLIRADRIAYLPILEEATQLLLSKEESLVACFIGFLHRLSYLFTSKEIALKIKVNGLPNYAHKSIDFPDYVFFIDLIAYAHSRLSDNLMEQIARAIVDNLCPRELDDTISQVQIQLVPDVNEFPEPLNPLSVIDFTPEQLMERKILKAQLEILAAKLIEVMEDEAKKVNLKIREPRTDEDDEEWRAAEVD